MDKQVAETVYGKHHKFEVVKESSFLSLKYYVYKDGNPIKEPIQALTMQ